MAVASFFRQLYSLDTLDTRFTTSATTPLKAASDVSAKKTDSTEDKSKSQLPDGASPSKWNTLEFYFYALVFVFCVPNMYKTVWDVSQPDQPNYPKYKDKLSDGWLFGRKVDNSDGQYAGFRDNVPYLAVVLVLHPLLRRVSEYFTRGSAPSKPLIDAASAHFKSRVTFDFIFALVFITALHGFSALKILIILYINFNIATLLPKTYIPAATWIFNVATLFANELAHGYPFADLATAMLPSFTGAKDWGKSMDSYGGLQPRWEILFNFTVLRMISFNMDYYWSLDRDRSGSPVEAKKKQLDPSSLSERDRISTSAAPSHFQSLPTYLAYILYSPLYLAGPILTFNDYISQSTYPPPSLTARRTTLYALRFLLTLLCMEFLLHTIYVVAISSTARSDPTQWSSYTPLQLSMLAYFNLHIIWLKLLLPWRFFRLWSLLDGIDPPENVVRCMSDNYSALAFWRAWHRSFNRWIVRYVYIPLGGGGGAPAAPGADGGRKQKQPRYRAILNLLVVFTFVALWHDIQLQLLTWGWLITLFVLPEVLAGYAFPASAWRERPTTYRILCGVGAVFNILMMMSANLVGFGVGTDGFKGLVGGIWESGWTGLGFMGVACGILFVGAQVMFEHREGEKRRGIKLKC